MKEKSITASEFDQKFDKGDDMTEFLDLDNVSKPGNHLKRITVNFPEWMVKDLDNISKKLGVSRQSIIKVFISEKLKEQQNF